MGIMFKLAYQMLRYRTDERQVGSNLSWSTDNFVILYFLFLKLVLCTTQMTYRVIGR